LVETFMEWLEERVVTLSEEDHGKCYARGLGLNVMAKLMTFVDTLPRSQAGMVDGAIA